METYLFDDDIDKTFVVAADETDPNESHGLDVGTRVRLVGLPRRVRGAPPPEPQWRCFDVIDGPEAGEWRNLDARHIEPEKG